MNIIGCRKCKRPIKSCCSHKHEYWEIILNLSGNVKSCIGDKEYNISPGSVMVVPPGIFHDGISEKNYFDICLEAYKLDFSDVLVVQDLDGSIQKLFNMLYKVFIEKEKNYNVIADSLVETMCQYIKKNSNMNIKYLFVNDLKNDIYENLSNSDFRISEYILKSGYNSDYFRRCFKKETGKTPVEYMTMLRIEKAKNLLAHELSLRVEDISDSCGFNDCFYFSKCFKKYTGMSPMQYRKENKWQ